MFNGGEEESGMGLKMLRARSAQSTQGGQNTILRCLIMTADGLRITAFRGFSAIRRLGIFKRLTIKPRTVNTRA